MQSGMNTISIDVPEKTSKTEVENIIKKNKIKEGDTIKIWSYQAKGEKSPTRFFVIGWYPTANKVFLLPKWAGIYVIILGVKQVERISQIFFWKIVGSNEVNVLPSIHGFMFGNFD